MLFYTGFVLSTVAYVAYLIGFVRIDYPNYIVFHFYSGLRLILIKDYIFQVKVGFTSVYLLNGNLLFKWLIWITKLLLIFTSYIPTYSLEKSNLNCAYKKVQLFFTYLDQWDFKRMCLIAWSALTFNTIRTIEQYFRL